MPTSSNSQFVSNEYKGGELEPLSNSFPKNKKDEKKFLNYWRTEMKWKELYFEDEEYKP